MDSHVVLFNGGAIKHFVIFGLAFPYYSFFVLLGLVVGGFTLWILNGQLKKDLIRGDHSFIIVSAGLLGGVLGAKLPIWIMYFDQIFGQRLNIAAIFSGRTILGGLIGGLIAVQVTKKVLKINRRTGNQLAPAIAIGMVVGRLGCFFQGCCAGVVTQLPWGVDFGDGLFRHPTQIYEVLFHLTAFVILLFRPERKKEGGELLAGYFISYFIYRFISEWIRINPEKWLGLTVYQWLCLVGIGIMTVKIRKMKVKSNYNQNT